MSTDLAELNIRLDDVGIPEQNIENVKIVGNPLHKSEPELISLYKNSPNKFLSHQARHSCGSYILVDTRENIRIITSPSYCGGYIATLTDGYAITTTLSTALSYYELDEISINMFRLFHYISRGRYCRLPFGTMFDEVVRLPPGTDLQFDTAGTGFQRRSYLDSVSPPENFAAVLDEVSNSLSGENIVLALSGGIDSAALACAFLKNGVSFRAVTFDIGRAYRRSYDIASELGIEHEVIETPVPADGERLDQIEKSMSKDLMMYNNERLGFLGVDTAPGEIGVSGRNMDNMAAMKMEDVYPSRSLLQALKEPKPTIAEIFREFVPNVQYTDKYLENTLFRKAYLQTFPRLIPALSTITETTLDARLGPDLFHNSKYTVDAEANPKQVLLGVLSSWHPNIRENPLKQKELRGNIDASEFEYSYLDEELNKFEQIDSYGVHNSTKAVKHLLYFSFSQNAQKTPAQLLPTPFQSETPLSYGPSLSYFFNKSHPIHTITHPKQEPYEYFESFTGKSYEDVITTENKPYNLSGESSLLSANIEIFTKENSVALRLVDSQFATALEELYAEYKKQVEETEYNTRGELRKLQRVLNLELLLNESLI